MLRVIPLAYGSLGAFTLVVQTILLREFFVVAAGNEVSFGIAMAGWLIGIGAGSLAGAFFRSRRQTTAVPFAWSVLALGAVAPLILAAIRGLHSFARLPQGMLLPMAQALALVPLISLPFCALSGFVFPLASRLLPPASEKPVHAVTRAYIWESLGALAGGVFYSLLLVGRLHPLTIIVLLALPLLAAAGAIARAAGGRKTALAIMLALGFSLAALASGAAAGSDNWLARLRWRGLAAAELVEVRDTRFQNLQLGQRGGQFSLFANGQLAAVFPDDAGNELLAAQLIAQHPRPRNILVIGDVAGGLARHLLRYPLASLTAVEIDAGVAAMIVRHLDDPGRRALSDPRLQQRILDGRRFVLQEARKKERRPRRYDMVFIHQPDAWTAHINRYYTREFFLDLRRILAPGGVVALRLAAAENYASELVIPYTAVIYKTLESVFPATALSPGASSFLFASAASASVSQDPDVLSRRYRDMAPGPARLAPLFASLYPAEKTAFLRTALRAAHVPSLNRDDLPVGYYLGSRLLGWSTGSPLPHWLDRFAAVPIPVALAFLALLILLPLFWCRRRLGGGFAVAPTMLAAACGGFAGLASEVTAIFIFQNSWGFVYQAIGILIALFMLGLSAGAAWASGRIARTEPTAAAAARALVGVLLLIGLTGLSFLLARRVFQGGAGGLLLAAWLGGIGFLVGSILPLGLRVLGHIPAGQGAGYLNAGDYLGGAAGSLLTAAFFLPLLGTGKSLLLISLVVLAAATPLALAVHGAQGRK